MQTPNSAVLVAIAKSENRNLIEWCVYHLLLGFDKIVIYDNGENDPDIESIADMETVSIIDWTSIEGVSPQISAYNDALARLDGHFQFAAFIDIDEFICITGNQTLKEWLSDLPHDVGAVALNQHVFGSSGQKVRKKGLVIERFLRANEKDDDENRWVKSIYRLENVREITSAHRGILNEGRYVLPDGGDAFDPSGSYIGGDGLPQQARRVDFSSLKLNHYMLKSLEEFKIKQKRGGASATTQELRLARAADDGYFWRREEVCNSQYDGRMLRRCRELKLALRALGPVGLTATHQSRPSN